MVKNAFVLQKVEFLETTSIVNMCACSKTIVLSLKSKEERARAARKSRKGLRAAEL